MSDIGILAKPNTTVEINNDEEVGIIPTSSTYSQVYSLTHKSNGERASNLDRSYISFSFGGKWIEDWNLIVTYSDNIERQATADFEDLTSEYDVVNGKFYWGTYFKSNILNFTLSTDGMTQSQLDDFKNWFAPGENRELILAEHPNRAIMARISTPITLNVVPFEKDIVLTIGGNTHLVTIAEYKGDIDIEFTMDSPFWYSKNNLIRNGTYTKDTLKIMVEDNIPSREMIKNTTVFGSDIYKYYSDTDSVALVNSLTIPSESPTLATHPLIYYAGTAPCYPIISFKMIPTFSSSGYIDNPSNSYAYTTSMKINYLKLSGSPDQILYLSCPSIYTYFNEAVSIFKNAKYTTVKELRENITEKIRHVRIRSLALHFLNYLDRFSISFSGNDSNIEITQDTVLNSSIRNKLIALMKSAFSRDYALPIIYNINSQTGQVTANMGYLTTDDYPVNKSSTTTISSSFPYADYNRWMHLEDISDVIQSNFLVLKERNNFLSSGIIDYSLSKNFLSHNFSQPLENFTISYNYLYF